MKILVPVKRVVDYNVKVRVKSDGSGVDIANVKMSMNPFDEIGVEEAVRLREKGAATDVIAVSCGCHAVQETLRTAMAIGADRAILVECSDELQPLAVAKLLAALVKKEAARADHPGQAGHRRRLQPDRADAGRTAGAAASDLRQQGRGRRRRRQGHARDRRRPGDRQLKLPAVITTDLRLNEPRYVTLPNIMKAKKKPLEVFKPADLGVDVTRASRPEGREPPKRGAGIKVPDVATLVDKLKNVAKVI
jgi:electron transfer flavoprotein beta subunit